MAAGVLSIVFHIYGALPPHQNVGIIGAVLGAVVGLVLLNAALRYGRTTATAAPARHRA